MDVVGFLPPRLFQNMAPLFGRNNESLLDSESGNDSGSESEGNNRSDSGSRSSSAESESDKEDQSALRSQSPANSQASESSGSAGPASRRNSASSAGSAGRGRSASNSPTEGASRKDSSRSPKSGSGSPGRGSDDGRFRSESPAEGSEKNSERSRSATPEVSETRAGSPGSSKGSRQSSPGTKSGSGDSDNESRGSVDRNVKSGSRTPSEKAGSRSPSKKSVSQSNSESEDDKIRSSSPKRRSKSPGKGGSKSPKGKEKNRSRRSKSESGSESDDGNAKDASRKRKRAVLSDDSGSEAERKKQVTRGDKEDESEKDLVVDAEALFGDASDISSDEEGKKKKKDEMSLENERVRGEESDADSNKAKSGEEDNEMDVGEKDEEDKENLPEEPVPETRIDVHIPKITTDLGKEIHFVKLPNFLSVETRPFDPMTYEDEIDEEETLDEEGRARLKLKVENTIRWREVRTPNGDYEKQSNARFVKWSDGSLSLHLGSEIFDVCKQPLQGDHNHLFIRQGTGLQGQAVFRTKLTFRPHSTESFTHRKMTLSLADRSQKTARIKVLSLVGKDPEAHRGELIKKEEEKLRASVRRESKQKRIREKGASRGLSAGYLEPDRYDSDDEGISLNAIKKQHKNKFSNPKEDRTHIYSSDEDGSDIETRRARRLDKAKALKDSDSDASGGRGEEKSGSSGDD